MSDKTPGDFATEVIWIAATVIAAGLVIKGTRTTSRVLARRINKFRKAKP
jgi:hypothetical protein